MDVQAQSLLQQRNAQWQEAKNEFIKANEAKLRLAISGLFSKLALRASDESEFLTDESLVFNPRQDIQVNIGDATFTASIGLNQVREVEDEAILVFDLNLFGQNDAEDEVYTTELLLHWRDNTLMAGDTLTSRYAGLED